MTKLDPPDFSARHALMDKINAIIEPLKAKRDEIAALKVNIEEHGHEVMRGGGRLTIEIEAFGSFPHPAVGDLRDAGGFVTGPGSELVYARGGQVLSRSRVDFRLPGPKIAKPVLEVDGNEVVYRFWQMGPSLEFEVGFPMCGRECAERASMVGVDHRRRVVAVFHEYGAMRARGFPTVADADAWLEAEEAAGFLSRTGIVELKGPALRLIDGGAKDE